MKEIDQRINDELLISCNCGYPHFLQFNSSTDPYKYENTDEKMKTTPKNMRYKHYYISFIEKSDKGFLQKLKDCWNYLFTRHGEICYSGIGITSKDMDKIKKHFEKYQTL